MSKLDVEVEVRAVVALNGGYAVFLGNAEKVFVLFVDQGVGAAIAMYLQGVPKPRPLTHDLLANVLAALGAKVQRLLVNDCKGDTYFATLVLSAENELTEKKLLELDARPSDGIAMALQQRAPLYVSQEVSEGAENMTVAEAKVAPESFRACIHLLLHPKAATLPSRTRCPHPHMTKLQMLTGGLIVATAFTFAKSDAADIPAEGGKDVQVQNAPAAVPIDAGERQNWLLHFQATEIFQGQPGGFSSPYRGPNSLVPSDNFRQTSSIDVFLGVRLWNGGELYFNPEYFQGFGLGTTHGVAAFPNAEAYKVGKYRGDVFIPHLFLRQTWGFGGEQEHLDADLLTLAQNVDVSRLTLTLGKLAVGDQFDNNAYAHDQRHQFLNWALVDQGSFDYAADSLGYEYGVTLELNQKAWALRWGTFTVPRVSNGLATDGHYDKAWQQVVEWEGRYSLGGHPGKVRLLGWLEHAHFGSYRATTDNPVLGEDIAQTRRYRYSYGFGINVEQEVTKDIGAFLRAGYRDPNYEVWQFTDVDESLSLGMQVKGTAWRRPDDTFGLAEVLDGIGHQHRAYLNAGGLGPLIGDGKLPHYGLENVVETYYDVALTKWAHLGFDYQFVANPAYNEDRGPIHVFSARLHFQY